MAQQEQKKVEEGIPLRVFALEMDELTKLANEWATLKELGFSIETVTLIPDPQVAGDIICRSCC